MTTIFNPKISIITATFNSEECIEKCLVSIEDQSFRNFEHIIIDGLSTDKTLEIVNNFKSPYRIVISEPDRGIYDALNKGIQFAKGDIVGFLHSDDTFSAPFILELIAKSFDENNIDATYGNLKYVSRQGALIRYWKSSKFQESSLKFGWMPPHPTLYVKRAWYTNNGGFNINYKISSDYEITRKMFSDLNFKSYYIDECLIMMTSGGASNKSIKNICRKSIEDFNILRSMGQMVLPSIFTLLMKNIRKLNDFLNAHK